MRKWRECITVNLEARLLGLGKKLFIQSACTRPDATVPPSRRQQGKKSEGWVVAVLKDPASFPEASCVVGVLQCNVFSLSKKFGNHWKTA